MLAELCRTAGTNPFAQAIRDLSIISFYFLCRHGEATAPSSADSESAPFRLCDTEFIVGNTTYRADLIPINLLLAATSVRLEFTEQKNSNKGEKVAHVRSGHPTLCPVKATATSVAQL